MKGKLHQNVWSKQSEEANTPRGKPVQFYKPIFIETFHGAIPVLYN